MDDIGSTTTYLLILVLLMLSAFFSASETAFSAANMIRLRTMAEDGNKRAALAVKVAGQYDKLIATILIGNNLVNIAISSLVTVLATSYFKNYAVAIATGITTLVVLTFGEILPKSGEFDISELKPIMYHLDEIAHGRATKCECSAKFDGVENVV